MINRDIRPATLADGALLQAWANADDSLKWKKNTKNLISTDDHLTWLHSRLADPFTQIWIALYDGAPSGQVRLEKKGDFVYVDIYVVAEARGTGLASFALNESINRYTRLFRTQKFCAIVNHQNQISEKLFVKNGFHKANGKSTCWLQFVRVAVAY
jgi:RimJ/RimL family protein N-acetyltransferase